MKIIQVPRRFVVSEWGGTETTILQTSRALQRAGHEAAIFTSLALSDQRREEIQGVPVRRFPYSYPFLGLTADDRRDPQHDQRHERDELQDQQQRCHRDRQEAGEW